MIGAEGKLTVSGRGDFSNPYGDKPWSAYKERISSAEVNVTDMTCAYGLFSGCVNLRSVDLSGFNASNLINMERMFFDCNSLRSLDISSLDAGNTANMNDMFLGCSSLSEICSPYNVVVSAGLPAVTDTAWYLPDGTRITELPQNLSDTVLLTRYYTVGAPMITTTTPQLNMENVIRVKYVPYSYTVETNNIDDRNKITFSLVAGRLAEGLQIYPETGEIYGVPLETGEFPITVRADYSNPNYLSSYAELVLTVIDNTNENIASASDSGYEIIQPVQNINISSALGGESQVLISRGEYTEFVNLYLDGERLLEGTDYTSEAGSTRITILNQTLARKGAGTHTLGIEFRDKTSGILKRAAQNVIVSENLPSDDGNSNGSGNIISSNDGSNTTNDNEISETEEVDIIIYTVMPGDNLRKIAVKFYGIGDYWRKIYLDNANLIRNPNRIYVGQRLTIYLTKDKASTESGEYDNTYRVASGDNLWKIARRVYGDGRLWRWIYEANRAVITNPGKIRGGMLLKIPAL